MKKIYYPLAYCLAFLFVCSASFGQTFIPKSSVVGGGGFQFSTGTGKSESGGSTFEDTETSISFTPFATYYIADNVGLGAMISFESDKSKDKDGDFESSQSQIVFGPMARYYFAEGPFVQAFLGFGSRNSKSVSGGSEFESKYGVTQYEGGLGYSVRISDTILLDPMVGYQGISRKNKDDSDITNSFGGIFIRVGFTLILISQ